MVECLGRQFVFDDERHWADFDVVTRSDDLLVADPVAVEQCAVDAAQVADHDQAVFLAQPTVLATDLGGGMLAILVLSLLYDPKVALTVTAPALLVGNAHRLYLNRRVVNWAIARRIIVGALPGSIVGGLVAMRLPVWVLNGMLQVANMIELGQIKAGLVVKIDRIIRHRGLTQTAAARAMGIDQPKVSAILAGQFRGYSVERLMRFLVALGQDVEIVVKPRKHRVAELRVA